MTLSDFLSTRYKKYGRMSPDLDCWGLVRLARAELFGLELLPSHVEIDPADKDGLTKATGQVKDAEGFVKVPAKLGAIATAWRARLCVHVGIVVKCDGRLWILETDEPNGPSLTTIPRFESRYTSVIYYDNQNLS